MFSACTSIGILPAVCEASTTRWMPRPAHRRPISPTGWMVPMTFDAWLTATTFVFLLNFDAIAAGSTNPPASNATWSTSTPPFVAR